MRPLAFIPFLALVVALAAPGPATARPACADAVIADWSDGRIDRVYAAACYAKALDTLPEDVRAYSTAKDDIAAALLARIRAQTRTARAAPVEPADRSRRLSVRDPARAAGDATIPAASEVAEASPVPVPLLVAAGIALLLCAAGAAQVIARWHRGHEPRRPVGQC